MQDRDLAGIYVHIPFCIQKCFYCDFVSYANMASYFLPYKNALISEIRAVRQNADKKIKSVFIGGGTPTVLPVSYIEEIMAEIKKFDLTEDVEITIEANPRTLSQKMLKGIKNSGINRLSIGLQAWQDSLLQALGRAHRLADFTHNYEDARKIGFNNINIDLMFSLPNQTLAMWTETLVNVMKLNPEHISIYSLIVEEGTVFSKLYEEGSLILTDEYTDRKMYDRAKEILNKNYYIQYEISNFAKTDLFSKHNVLYWERQDYYGFGLNAHSLIENERYANTDSMDAYILNAGNPELLQKDRLVLSEKDQISEFMFLGLRMTKGVSIDQFYRLFGINMTCLYKDMIEKNISDGLLKIEDRRIFLTEKGIDLSNRVMADFLLD